MPAPYTCVGSCMISISVPESTTWFQFQNWLEEAAKIFNGDHLEAVVIREEMASVKEEVDKAVRQRG